MSTQNRIDDKLKIALDVRKFEVGLYWKRASYFWAFIAAIFAGYFLVATAKVPDGPDAARYWTFIDQRDFLKLILAGLGTVFSFGWYVANRGSKYWQDNWESKVIALEKPILGDLFSERKTRDEFRVFRLQSAYPKSVTKVNLLLCLFTFAVWIFLLFQQFKFGELCLRYYTIFPRENIFLTLVIVAVVLLIIATKSSEIKGNIVWWPWDKTGEKSCN